MIRRLRSDLNEPAYPTLPGSSLNNPSPREFTDTELTDWINDALRDISRRAETLITYDTSIQIPAYGENPSQPIPVYNLLDDIVRINRVEFQVYGDSSQVYPLEAQTQNWMDQIWAMDQLSTMAWPSFYVQRGYPGGTGRNNYEIQIYPQPAQAGQLNIFYYRLPLRLTDPVVNPSQYLVTLDLIEGWDDMVLDYARIKAMIKTRNPDWQTSQALYEAKMENLVNQTRQFFDQPQYFKYDNQLTPWGSDSWGGW